MQAEAIITADLLTTSMPVNLDFPTMVPDYDNEYEEMFENFSYYLTEDMQRQAVELEQKLNRLAHVTQIVVPLIITIILLIGVIGNTLVIYVTIVTKRTKKHPIHSLFVLNLAASDLAFLIVCAPYQITVNTVNGWPFGSFLCPTIPFLAICTTAVSVFTICALAWMRFMALIIPFRFRKSRISTRKAGHVVLAVVWLAAILLSLPNALYFQLTDSDRGVAHCSWHGYRSSKIYSVFLICTTYAIPLVLVSGFYFMIGREVFCYMLRHASSTKGGNSTPKEERKDCAKSTVVVLCLILAFLLCGLPHQVSSILKLLQIDQLKHVIALYILKMVSHCMTYAHACVNPLIYTFASPGFRNSLRESLRGRAKRCGGSGCSTCDGKGICGRALYAGRCHKLSDNSKRRRSSAYTGTNAIRTEQMQLFSSRSCNGINEVNPRSGFTSKASSPISLSNLRSNSTKKMMLVRSNMNPMTRSLNALSANNVECLGKKIQNNYLPKHSSMKNGAIIHPSLSTNDIMFASTSTEV